MTSEWRCGLRAAVVEVVCSGVLNLCWMLNTNLDSLIWCAQLLLGLQHRRQSLAVWKSKTGNRLRQLWGRGALVGDFSLSVAVGSHASDCQQQQAFILVLYFR